MATLNYNHLRYFWAVAHEGNLTRAAEQLGVSQSALSVQIKKLEDRLGQPLFERRGRSLVLTEAGRMALDRADAIFATGDELVALLGGRDHAIRQVLRVGSAATLSRNFQLDFLRPLLGRDDVEVVVRSGGPADLLAALEAHRLDVVLATAAPMSDAATPWISQRIAEQPVGLMGTPARLKDPGAPLARLLADHPLVLPPLESALRQSIDTLCNRLGVQPRIAAEIDDMAMMRLLAREDVGLAVLPPVVVKDELAAGLLVEAEAHPGLNETFYAITLKRRFPNPLLRELMS
ncbi:MAG: LysR family transcriptional regulator [Polymorphobacter sp.]|uniref:LysR family transcriptional regulator n=1 Tax=Polymorphobacter sp. TaxID=1909290 RepID=UPI003A873F63